MLLCIWFPLESGVVALDVVESWCGEQNIPSVCCSNHSVPTRLSVSNANLCYTFPSLPCSRQLQNFQGHIFRTNLLSDPARILSSRVEFWPLKIVDRKTWKPQSNKICVKRDSRFPNAELKWDPRIHVWFAIWNLPKMMSHNCIYLCHKSQPKHR